MKTLRVIASIFIVGISLFQMVIPISFSESASTRLNVLILNSYEYSNPWTITQERGIVEGLKPYSGKIILYHEYMDTKRLSGDRYDQAFLSYLMSKYGKMKIDIVVTTDDYATLFIQKYRSQLGMKNTPVVFSGVNDLSFKAENMVGVYETIDIRGTVEMIKGLHGKDTPIILITDKTLSSEAITKGISEDKKWLEQNEVTLFAVNDPQVLRKKLMNEHKGAILFLLFNQDSEGNIYNYYEGLELVKSLTVLPIYSVWDFYIGYGVVGGSVLTETDMREKMITFIERIMAGAKVSSLVSVNATAKDVVDYPVMKHYGLEQKIPVGTEIKNEPVRFFAQYYQIILVFSTLVGSLIIVIILMINAIRQKNKYYLMVSEHKNEIIQINQKLEKKINEQQQTLSATEERSQELLHQILILKKKVSFSDKIPHVFHEINTILSLMQSKVQYMSSFGNKIYASRGIEVEERFEEMHKLLSDSGELLELSLESVMQLVSATKTCYSDLSVQDLRNFKIAPFTEAFWTMFKTTLKKKRVSFVMKIPEDVSLYGNPGDYLNILAILFGNAVRHGYSSHNDRELRIEIEAYSSPHSIHIIFRDDGDGCTTEHLERAIKNGEDSIAANGSGIGLYHLHLLVTESMFGQLSLNGDVDEGVTVRINIPKAGE